MSLCRDERDDGVNDISNVRCHGWDMGIVKERKDNNTVQRDERSLEHGFEKVKITHIPDSFVP